MSLGNNKIEGRRSKSEGYLSPEEGIVGIEDDSGQSFAPDTDSISSGEEIIGEFRTELFRSSMPSALLASNAEAINRVGAEQSMDSSGQGSTNDVLEQDNKAQDNITSVSSLEDENNIIAAGGRYSYSFSSVISDAINNSIFRLQLSFYDLMDYFSGRIYDAESDSESENEYQESSGQAPINEFTDTPILDSPFVSVPSPQASYAPTAQLPTPGTFYGESSPVPAPIATPGVRPIIRSLNIESTFPFSDHQQDGGESQEIKEIFSHHELQVSHHELQERVRLHYQKFIICESHLKKAYELFKQLGEKKKLYKERYYSNPEVNENESLYAMIFDVQIISIVGRSKKWYKLMKKESRALFLAKKALKNLQDSSLQFSPQAKNLEEDECVEIIIPADEQNIVEIAEVYTPEWEINTPSRNISDIGEMTAMNESLLNLPQGIAISDHPSVSTTNSSHININGYVISLDNIWPAQTINWFYASSERYLDQRRNEEADITVSALSELLQEIDGSVDSAEVSAAIPSEIQPPDTRANLSQPSPDISKEDEDAYLQPSKRSRLNSYAETEEGGNSNNSYSAAFYSYTSATPSPTVTASFIMSYNKENKNKEEPVAAPSPIVTPSPTVLAQPTYRNEDINHTHPEILGAFPHEVLAEYIS